MNDRKSHHTYGPVYDLRKASSREGLSHIVTAVSTLAHKVCCPFSFKLSVGDRVRVNPGHKVGRVASQTGPHQLSVVTAAHREHPTVPHTSTTTRRTQNPPLNRLGSAESPLGRRKAPIDAHHAAGRSSMLPTASERLPPAARPKPTLPLLPCVVNGKTMNIP